MNKQPRAFVSEIILYVMPNGDCRPAIIVAVAADNTVNLQVFTNGEADLQSYQRLARMSAWRHWVEHGHLHVSGVEADFVNHKPGTWHRQEKGD